MKFTVNQGLEVLQQTPETLKSMLSNLSDDWIFTNEGGDTWSPYDIVGHLIHGEKTDWIPRLKIILRDDQDKTFQSFDRFAQFENSKGKSLIELLNEFQQLRQENLNDLKQLSLSESQLNRQGIHPELGPVTASELLACWVTHDLSHLAQINRVLAKQ
ncbi:MAG: DinB family protein, partial [Psychroserpens sp.]|nr:DinB family protein [Psychroserpens sp.]